MRLATKLRINNNNNINNDGSLAAKALGRLEALAAAAAYRAKLFFLSPTPAFRQVSWRVCLHQALSALSLTSLGACAQKFFSLHHS